MRRTRELARSVTSMLRGPRYEPVRECRTTLADVLGGQISASQLWEWTRALADAGFNVSVMINEQTGQYDVSIFASERA